MIHRRHFISLLGGAAAAWPVAALGQQPAMPVIGFLHGGSSEESSSRVAAFIRGLRETGYDEGQNVTVEYRWAMGHYDRLPSLAADLVGRPVSVLAGTTTPAAIAAKAATTKIPVVFTTGGDPVKLGLVSSLNRPGGNVTGATLLSRVLAAKQLGLLRELLPRAERVCLLINPSDANAKSVVADAHTAAVTLGHKLTILQASTDDQIDTAFLALAQQHVEGLVVDGDSYLLSRRQKLLSLMERTAIPAIYPFREYVDAGGLMSYSPNLSDTYRQAGIYAGRILKGDKPSDLPIVQPTKFDLLINLKVAKVLGLEIPPKLLALADEVIE